MKLYQIMQKIRKPKKCQWTYDCIICPRCRAIAFIKSETPLWMNRGHCFRCGKYLTWAIENKSAPDNKTKAGFSIKFPYNTGTFVLTDKENVDPNNPQSLLGRLGTIACYNCVDERDGDDNFLVVVSGFKDSWGGEYLISDIRLATESEVECYKQLKGIDKE